MSRITPSVMRPATPRLAMRAHRMSPKIPASVTPPAASATVTQPAGIASMAARVEVGEAQDAGVAISSRAGTKRNVKASPMMRAPAGPSSNAPRIQTLRKPFLSSTVVSVAVDTGRKAAMISGE
jgi:hypothetical protein